MMDKIKVGDREIITYIFDNSTVPEAIEELRCLEEKYGEDLVRLDLEYSCEYTDIIVRFMRLETDKEWETRRNENQKRADRELKKEEKERLEYERLRVKFGDN